MRTHYGQRMVPGAAALPPRPLTAPPTPPPASGGRPTEHPVRCPARLSFSVLPGDHTHECVYPARRPEGVEGVLEHRCHCGMTWTERTDVAPDFTYTITPTHGAEPKETQQ